MKNVKIVFQGDSITDAGRDREDLHNLGQGYPFYAAKCISENNPDISFEFINKGISGNRTCQLFDRLYADTISFKPDIVSILITINDIWHRYGPGVVLTTDEQIALNYRCILERLKKETDAKIVILAPFVLDAQDKDNLREDIKTVLPIVRKLADEYADVYIPLDEIFDEAMKTQPAPLYYSNDGVHPNKNGSEFIGNIYAEAIKPLLK